MTVRWTRNTFARLPLREAKKPNLQIRITRYILTVTLIKHATRNEPCILCPKESLWESTFCRWTVMRVSNWCSRECAAVCGTRRWSCASLCWVQPTRSFRSLACRSQTHSMWLTVRTCCTGVATSISSIWMTNKRSSGCCTLLVN